MMEHTVRAWLGAYGYREIRMPVLERTELFVRSIGEVTDIVEKEMYTFVDELNGESLTLRPEGTASCVRAAIEHNLLYAGPQRLWYAGPMFRHERPQKGRYRQFHQFGVEALGYAGPDIDIEQIVMCARLWRLLGVGPLELELNTLGSAEARARYRTRLVEYLSGIATRSMRTRSGGSMQTRCACSTARIRRCSASSPTRRALRTISTKSRRCISRRCRRGCAAGIAFRLNPRLVRGLDYYNRTVFEWTTDRLGAQGTVCAGGRYDGLIEQIGGKAAPACGYAMGVERLIALMKEATTLKPPVPDVRRTAGRGRGALRGRRRREVERRGGERGASLRRGQLQVADEESRCERRALRGHHRRRRGQCRRAYAQSFARAGDAGETPPRRGAESRAAAIPDLNFQAEDMAYDLEEQEQIDAIKGWWEEYGKLVMLGVIACLLTIAAFQGWRYYRVQQAQGAATLFMQLDEAQRLNDPKRVRDIAAQLIDKYGRTHYAGMAALAAAKAGYTTGETEEAKKNLQWVVEHAKEDEMRDVARLRLTGVLLDEKKYDEALKLLDTKAGEPYAMLYADLKGDVLTAQGKLAEARAAYQLALDKSDSNSKVSTCDRGEARRTG